MRPLQPRKWTRLTWIALLLAAVPTHAERWLVRQGPLALKASAPGVAAFTNAPLEEHGLRLLKAFRLVPWALVEGSSDAIQTTRAAGWIDQAEPDFPRYPIGTPAARAAAFPWVLALGALAIAACGGDDDDDKDEETCGADLGQTPSWGALGIHADQAHSLSRGRGVRVAVIDSGIDAEHPDLDVVDGRNFVQGSPAPGATEEWDDCFGHGTHVAGTLAAKDNQIGTLGVAPEAELYAARVFDCAGERGAVSNVIAAVEWAVSQQVQVINMSLGSHSQSVGEEEAMDAALEAGVVLVAASGNEESDCACSTMTFPAAYDSVIAVAAIDESGAVAQFSLGGPDQELAAPGVNVRSSVPLCSAVLADVRTGATGYDALGMEFSGTGTVRGGLYSCGLALAASDCPSGVGGNIALIERGQNLFSEKVQNATTAGAKAVIVYNHLEEGGGLFSGTLQDDANWIPTVAVSNSSGVAMLALGNGTSAAVDVNPGSYDIYSGTSMASPHVAGIAALLLQLDPNLSPTAVRARLRATAEDIAPAGRDERSGFGRVDALRAVTGVAKVASRDVPVSHTAEPGGRSGIGTHHAPM